MIWGRHRRRRDRALLRRASAADLEMGRAKRPATSRSSPPTAARRQSRRHRRRGGQIKDLPPWLPGAVAPSRTAASATITSTRSARPRRGGEPDRAASPGRFDPDPAARQNLFLTQERTFGRKVQEVLATVAGAHLHQGSDPRALNPRVYMGAGAYGVDATARRYFGKSARDGDADGAAMLAGLLKEPPRATAPRASRSRQGARPHRAPRAEFGNRRHHRGRSKRRSPSRA